MHNSNKLYGPWSLPLARNRGFQFTTRPGFSLGRETALYSFNPTSSKANCNPDLRPCLYYMVILFIFRMIFIGFGKIIELLNYIK